ncbi:type I polyketide synthase [Micromonospora chaiyaphumensis]|uniref:Acyl transferase domain-containing protein n=1 Tax=Micromonospora chaiyaphumensis TaxID=307119 RepID=A0A1C4VZW7_9ACTN|nr:type I polyketide synthase [Micromonospora chaiyaphumensis]SCE89478.1 Acyl transferase domain-containing protein [Micromonospora chaiyaphumensis]
MATGLEIAIVGMACRLPGADGPDQFWRNLRDGVESISHFEAAELAGAGVPEQALADPGYVRAQAVLPDSDRFDAAFFGINPKEADLMDPQQRVLLECAWTALEDAGYDPDRVDGPVGVYAGTYYNSYLPLLPPTDDVAEQFARNIANEKDYVATRLAYKLNLTGPAVTVQTACSTSLVAVHQAAQALLAGACDLALAGGATVRAEQVVGYPYQPGGIFSSDGHCRAFDDDAEGTVPGNGVGVVVLKRLDDALADGDTVYAVIRGSAVGNDGGERAGFTAPGVAGQARVIAAAYAVAEVDPATVGYVEAHGSATRLGDPIEVEALTRVFGPAGADGCAIGSVKTNIGHTHAAAGVAGLIKAVQALRHGQIPPSLHHDRPNRAIDFGATPFVVSTRLTDFPRRDHPRRAGVSSFGMGGTGVHVVLEEAPPPAAAPSPAPAGLRLLALSARSAPALEERTDALAAHLADRPEADLAAVAHTLWQGRRPFGHRRVVVAADPAEAAAALAARDPRRVLTGAPGDARPDVAFLVPGVGDQRRGLGYELYRTQPAYRSAVDECAELLAPLLGRDIRTLLHPAPGAAAAGPADLRRLLGRGTPAAGEEPEPLHRTRYAQPAAFVTGYALARLWAAHGVRPAALIGYSLGEYVAACLAGVFTLPDALRLVVRRAQLIDRLPAGAMLAVPAAETEVAADLVPGVHVAAVNGPTLCVLAGVPEAVAEVERRLLAAGRAVRRLPTGHAFHTPLMDPVVEEFGDLVTSVARRPPAVPYVSNVTGTWVTGDEATDPAFWVAHLRRPVRFADGIAELCVEPDRVLVELGPGQALGSLAAQVGSAATPPVSSLPGAFDRDPEAVHFLRAAGRLWLAGVPLTPPVPADRPPRRVPLPTYPFQRRRHWAAGPAGSRPHRAAPSLTRRPDVADFFQVPAWATLPPRPRRDAAAGTGHWLLLADDQGLGAALAAEVAPGADSVTVVQRADRDAPGLRRLADGRYAMPAADGDYPELLAELARTGRRPDRIVHLWTVGTGPGTGEREATERGFGSLLPLARALAGHPGDEPVDLAVVTADLRRVTGAEAGSPLAATALGVCLVLPLEHPHLRCRALDVTLSGGGPAEVAAALREELCDPAGPATVVLRGRHRFGPTYQTVPLPPAAGPARGGNYLITGGLGGVGLSLARELARTENAGLALVSRTALPPRQRWDEWLATRPAGATADRIRAVHELERLGARVAVLTADVTDPGQLHEAARHAVAALGPVHTVVHAAGVAGGGLIQLKEPAAAARVLAPKVRGGLAVVDLARRVGARTVVLCSSTLSLSGGIGQVDYVAANAFLDALAQHAAGQPGPEVVSVNWDAWQEVGMAQRHLAGPDPAAAPAHPVDHPLLSARPDVTDGHAVYDATVDATDSWLVDEHRMLGDAVVPGTGHLELARAAHADLTGAGPTVLSDVRFHTPAVLGRTGRRELRVVLDRAAEPVRFTVVSPHPRANSADGPAWQVHATGQVAALAGDPPPDRPVERIVAEGRLRDLGRPEPVAVMGFGGRSRCLRRVWRGEREALAELVLPERYAADLDRLHLHPSLLDLAAGFVGTHLAGTFRIPISYGRLRCWRPLPRRVFSHHVYREDDRPDRETRTAQITLYDADGRVLVHIDDFVLKRVADLRRTLDAARTGSGPEIAGFRLPGGPSTGGAGLLGAHLATGLRPAEGADAFRRLLAAGIGPQVAVVAKDLDAVLADIAGRRVADAAAERPPAHPRPALGTPYRAPGDAVEARLVDIWQDLLGVDGVGVDDGFFELGGHSLLGLELVNRIGRELGLTVPLSLLFEARTVAELADVLRREPAAAGPAVMTESRGG